MYNVFHMKLFPVSTVHSPRQLPKTLIKSRQQERVHYNETYSYVQFYRSDRSVNTSKIDTYQKAYSWGTNLR